jgi:hypothetical protein
MNKRQCPKCKGFNTARKGSDNRRTGVFIKVYCKDCDEITNIPDFTIDRTQSGALEHKSRYVITAAVNATLAHKPFLAALEAYCSEHDAQLLIIPLRYKNPTRKGEESDDWYADPLRQYLYSRRESPIAGLKIMGDIKTQPTAVRPLSGLDSLTGSDCGIFGHTKVAMESVPTRGHELPKLLYTTGAVTRSQYSDTKAGAKGEFHHTLGAVVVERDDDMFHIRHLLPNQDGSFYDLDRYYSPQGIKKSKPISALVAGDLHAERHDPDCLAATFQNKDSIAKILRPQRIVLHDVLDFGSASHHNGFFEKFRRHHIGTNCVKSEVEYTLSLIDSIANKTKEVVIVDSNHNGHFLKWLSDDRNANDLQNAEVFAETRAGILPEIRDKGFCDPLEWWSRRLLKNRDKTKFLPPNESYTVHSIELAYHGDIGSNGARGSALNLSKVGAKTIIGHSHTPRIVDGCYQTGTSSLLDMGYNVGPSSWLHSHVIVYPNGKRTHIHVINGRWRA